MCLSQLIEELQDIVKRYPGSESLPVKFAYINDAQSKQGVRIEDVVDVSVIAGIEGLLFIEMQDSRTNLLFNPDEAELESLFNAEVQDVTSS